MYKKMGRNKPFYIERLRRMTIEQIGKLHDPRRSWFDNSLKFVVDALEYSAYPYKSILTVEDKSIDIFIKKDADQSTTLAASSRSYIKFYAPTIQSYIRYYGFNVLQAHVYIKTIIVHEYTHVDDFRWGIDLDEFRMEVRAFKAELKYIKERLDNM